MPASTTVNIEQQVLCCSQGSSYPTRLCRIGAFLLFLVAMAAVSGLGEVLGQRSASASSLQEPCVNRKDYRVALHPNLDKDCYHDTVPVLMQPPTLREPRVDTVGPFQWISDRWHACADWSADQPVYIRLLIGIASSLSRNDIQSGARGTAPLITVCIEQIGYTKIESG